jgi:molecular chaperone DnaK
MPPSLVVKKLLRILPTKSNHDDKSKIEEKLKEARELLAKTDAKKDEFDKISEELGQILQVVGQAVYGQQQTPPPQEGEAPQEEPKTEEPKNAEEGEIVN